MTVLWYILRVKPHKERFVYRQLQSHPVDPFLPMVRVHPKNPRAAKQRAYFPGYLFVCADLEELGANTLNWIPGAYGVVNFGGEPAVVPPHLITELRRRVETINAAGGLVFDRLEQGDRVRIISGPFAGYDALFDMRLPGKDRVQVLMTFLSQYPQPVKLNAADIERVKPHR
jgi:transcriptional antiterminator RfaH